MHQFRLHVVSLPHTQVTSEYIHCAYTSKVKNFCKMMSSLGHKVFLYASEECDVPVTEMITCITKKEQQEFFGGVDVKKDFFPISWKGDEPYWSIMNGRAVIEMRKRLQPTDVICLIGGYCQKSIADSFPKQQTMEFGIGYQGFFTDYKVFESYAWQNYTYGLQVGMSPQPPAGYNKRYENGQSFDVVIPNYFNPEDFPFSEKKDDYFLYIGRMIPRKGVHMAAEVCGTLGKKLVLAGQGGKMENGIFKGDNFELSGEHLEYVGTVDIKQRGELMSKAKAVFLLTNYHEPFGGTHIEAMFCGTPVITTDWGVFTETVTNGFNGYRTRTFGEILEAMRQVEKFTPDQYSKIREWAITNFSLDNIKWFYQDYLEQLYTLWGKGWYEESFNSRIKENRYLDYSPL